MMFGHGFGWMGGWGGYGGFGGIMMLFFVILIVLAVFGLARWGRRGMGMGGGCCSTGYTHPGGNDPLDIARERYAKGEITEEEFNRIKKGLS
jgi:putative membrane protein